MLTEFLSNENDYRKIFLELFITRLVNRMFSSYVNWTFVTVFIKARIWSLLNRFKAVSSFTPNLSEIWFNIIHLFHTHTPGRVSFWGYTAFISLFPPSCYMFHSHSVSSLNDHNSRWLVQIMNIHLYTLLLFLLALLPHLLSSFKHPHVFRSVINYVWKYESFRHLVRLFRWGIGPSLQTAVQ
jgi:hypothetical protein